MKKRILGLVIGLLLIGSNVFAADGDVIVNGNVGIGTTTPAAKLDIQGGDLKLKGIKITHVTGTNPTCPSGTGGFLMRKWAAKTCVDCSSCTIAAGWSPVPITCQYAGFAADYSCSAPLTCSSSNWTEAVCMGN